jgi:putative transposase
MIERNHPFLSVGTQCRLLSISRSSFYYAPQGETGMNLDLMLLVDKQFLETPFYGVRQMTWHLQNEGHAVCRVAPKCGIRKSTKSIGEWTEHGGRRR